jgi:hypothetical protein
MCQRCGKEEDEYLLQTAKSNVVIKTERLCEDCFKNAIVGED